MLRHLLLFTGLLLFSCQGPPGSVPFPKDQREFPPALAVPIKIPPAKKMNWVPSGREKKPAHRGKLVMEYSKDSSFQMEAFQPLRQALDSNIIKLEDLPSVPLSLKDLQKKKIHPSIVQLGHAHVVNAGKPVVESVFTKGILEFGQDQGLPGTEVHGIVEDKLGRMWFSTDNGLCMFNGESVFSWYKKQGLSRDLKNNLCIDKQGHIWAAGGGVDEIIPEQGIVRHYGKKEGLTSDRVVSVDIDTTGKLYINQVEGVDIYDPVAQTCIHIGEKQGLAIGLNIHHTIMDHVGRIWIASNCGGVSIIDPASEKMYLLKDKNGLGNNDCRTVIADRENKIWMGNWYGSVDCYDPETGVFLHLRQKHGLKFSYIYDLMQDKKGLIWISYLDYGIGAIDPKTRKMLHLYGKKGVVKSTVRCAFEDSEERLWFGTNGAGVLRYDPYNGDINNYNTQWWPAHTPILALMQDSSGLIWLSTNGGGSCTYDPVTSRAVRMNHGPDWTNAWQMDMRDDGKGNIYFCNDYKVLKFNLRTLSYANWNEKNGLPYEGVRSLLLERDHLLLGSTQGLIKFDIEKEDFYVLRSKNDSLQIAISCLYRGKNDKVWMGTYNSGLYLYDLKSSSVTHFSKAEGFGSYIYCITEDVNGRLWVGTGGTGLKILDLNNATVRTIDASNGLAEMTVLSLLFKDDQIYAGTARGLSIVDLSSNDMTIRNFGKTQGFRTSDFNPRAVLAAKDGSIWWGIGDMLTIYHPTNKKQLPHVPSITSVEVMENEMHFEMDSSDLIFIHPSDTIWSSARDTFYFKAAYKTSREHSDIKWKSTQGEYLLPTDLVLPHNKDHLTFHFTGNYPANSDKVRYRYILEGADKEWGPIVSDAKVDYRNIAPGNYTFKVCSSNFGSMWSEPAIFSFIVTPPWWKTKTAYLAYGLMLISLVGGYNRVRTNQLLKRQKELELTVDERTKEIAEQKRNVEEKQKEIVDSINYAKRIQFTLLAHEKVLRKHFHDHFILFQPKDIVSGDFYWATKAVYNTGIGKNSNNGNELFYLAVCDSTGHGVPGAFMSLLNISFLNEAINEKHIHEPHAILNYVRERLVTSISRDGAKDGMDGILMCFESDNERKNYRITYSAGNNAPLLFSNGVLTEQPFNKIPIGKGEKNEEFALHEVNAKKGDVIYLYTDGFADQFGGPKGKKFKYKQLNDLLTQHVHAPMEEQKQILTKALNDWKGEFEQVDDVCIVGIRV
jgi:ligand-binding sensor domain-containing protein/serine phosphatase RsbU (regulator of sigma subunit)